MRYRAQQSPHQCFARDDDHFTLWSQQRACCGLPFRSQRVLASFLTLSDYADALFRSFSRAVDRGWSPPTFCHGTKLLELLKNSLELSMWHFKH